MKPRNTVLASIATDDPKRLKPRTVKPKRGKGAKTRPRNTNKETPK